MISTAPKGFPARLGSPTLSYFGLFFLSGFPALLYQIVWQRALFTAYGVNAESVAVIVTAFMAGLGIGSLVGGRLSAINRASLLAVFGTIELGIGTFGWFSLDLFHRVALFTVGASAGKTGAITFFLLLFPTVLMGSTLPLLAAHFVSVTRNVGASVSSLYGVNTFGSVIACLVAATFAMRLLGEMGTVRLGTAINLLVAVSAFLLSSRRSLGGEHSVVPQDSTVQAPGAPLPLIAGLVLSALAGFTALAYEILWYRLYSFASGGRASCFALLLGFYLGGIAIGSMAVRDFCKTKNTPQQAAIGLATATVWAAVAGFLVAPGLANAVRLVPYQLTYSLVLFATTLLGASFPLVSHAVIRPMEKAGRPVSYLYVANIAGSALGSLIVGFVLMDYWSVRSISLFLLACGTGTAFFAMLASKVRLRALGAIGFAAAIVLAPLSGQLFSRIYEKLLYKQDFHLAEQFSHIVETRSGVIAVTGDGMVLGGGVYDGRFNTDLKHDTNGIFRAFALSGFHPHPSEVLMIGLSSGSWAQIIVNNPVVQHLTIVEINPGYLRLIPQYPEVASLLKNPKVNIVIDDGRRWLLAHPGLKFDAIVSNTTYHWRANISNLLSVEFLQLIRSHLGTDGIFYYNTTGSAEALMTGITVFPHALRVWNFLAVSDWPIVIDERRWEMALANYRIDGRLEFDLKDAAQRLALSQVVSLAGTLSGADPAQEVAIERDVTIRARLRGTPLITDDNMGTEWR
jgi:spermidine synthase